MNDIVCISPVDGREVARRAAMSEPEVAAALVEARRAQRDWASAPLSLRKSKMSAFVAAMQAMNDEIVPELALQMGRPVRYGGEMGSFVERATALIALADDSLKTYVPPAKPGFTRMIKRAPAGVVLVVAPWNYPYLTAVNSVLPALLSGNAVLLKHAAQTLLVGDRFQKAMDQAGLPKGLFQTVSLNHEGTTKLIASRGVDHVNFTGSVAAGQAIERAAAGAFTTLGLELGGKDPAYVRADADFDYAVANVVDGAYYNSGQCCCGVERVYVHASLYDRFVEALAATVSAYQLGDPLNPETTLGPMAAERFARLVREHTSEALARGAKALIDPTKFPADRDGSPYLMPQALIGVDHEMKVMREETFGPVVGIMKVASDEEAIRLMNDSPYGLTASVWTQDPEAAERIGDALETGTVFMNRCDYVDPYLAWTGVKDTGRGAGMSYLGFEAMTRPKSYHLRTNR